MHPPFRFVNFTYQNLITRIFLSQFTYKVNMQLSIYDCFNFSATCPDSYSSFQGSCYKIYSTVRTNSDARDECTREGGHLVDVTTQEEQDYLAEILTAAGSDDVWLGLTGSEDHAPLFWTDGSPLNFTAWDSNGRNKGETCVKMNIAENYKWGDKSCSHSTGYVCEFESKSSYVTVDILKKWST